MVSDNLKYLLKYNFPITILGIYIFSLQLNFSIVLAVFLLSYFLIYLVGFNFYIHRIVAHRQFKVDKRLGFILGYLGCFCMLGDPLTVSLIHRYHHRYADTEKDLHSPIHGYWHSIFGWMFKKNNIKSYIFLIKDLNIETNKHLHILLKYHFFIFWITIAIIGLISLSVLFGFILAMCLACILELVGNGTFYHSKLHKSASNNFYSLLSLSPFHADHHKDPAGRYVKDPLSKIYPFMIKVKILK